MEVILDNDGVSGASSAEELLSRAEQIKYEDYEFKMGFYINKGFRLFFKRPGEFLLFMIISIAIGALGAIPYIGWLASLFLSGPLAVGWFIVAHKVDKGEDFSFSNFFDGFQKVIPLLVVTLLVSLSIIAGFIVLIIPGIFLAVALTFATYPVFFNDLTASDAMKVSYRFVVKKWFHFFLFFIVLALINIGGAIALGIGLFVTIPASYLALYAAYQDIVRISFID